MASRRTPGLRFALLALATVASLAVIAAAGAPRAAAACPDAIHTVAPGSGPAAFTMLVRINQMDTAKTWTNFDSASGGLGGRVRPQDAFVINTRFEKTSPAEAEEVAQTLRAAFPCNRIISLNGLHSNPAFPGYFGALVGSTAGIYSFLLDYEAMDWNTARFHKPSMPRWSYRFPRNISRVRGFAFAMSSALAAGPNSGARTGLIPVDRRGWDYGILAQKLDKANRRISRHAGVQVVQTQETCAAGAKWFGREVKRLHTQYRFHTTYKKRRVRRHGKTVVKRVPVLKKIKKRARPNPRNLVTQVSFSDTPSPGHPLPVIATGPQTAERCTEVGMARGQRAFFYFASDASMRLLFQQPTMARLRPAFS